MEGPRSLNAIMNDLNQLTEVFEMLEGSKKNTAQYVHNTFVKNRSDEPKYS